MSTIRTAWVVAVCVEVIGFATQADAITYSVTVLTDHSSNAEAINDDGFVAGVKDYHPYRWDTRAGTGIELDSGRGSGMAINEHGDVAGHIREPITDWARAFRWTSGADPGHQMWMFPNLLGSALSSNAFGINDAGIVVGSCAGGANIGFIAAGSVLEEIPTPPGWSFWGAYDVNNHGMVVGYGQSPSSIVGGVVYDTVSTDILIPESNGWRANDAREVTDNRLVAGTAWTTSYPTSRGAYVYPVGFGPLNPMRDFAGGSEAYATNDRGDLVGFGRLPNDDMKYQFAHIRGRGTYVLNNLSGDGLNHITSLNDINDHGQIVAGGLHLNGRGVAVLLTPDTFVDTSGDSVSLDGGLASPGGLVASFPHLADPGTVNSTRSSPTVDDLASMYGPLPGTLAGDQVLQQWDVEFSGTLAGPASLTLCYDDQSLGFSEDMLRIAHWQGTGWQLLTPTVNPLANTATFDTLGFSPFVIIPVPEPVSLALLTAALLTLGGALLGRHRRR